MTLSESFRARGHPNITSTHKTTLMITRDTELTPKGNCVVAVGSEKGLLDLDLRLKEAMKRADAKITLKLEVGKAIFNVSGRGDDQSGDGVLFHELRHVEPDQGILTAKHEL